MTASVPPAVIPVRTKSQQHAVDAAIMRIAACLPDAPCPNTQPGAFFEAVADLFEATTNADAAGAIVASPDAPTVVGMSVGGWPQEQNSAGRWSDADQA